MSTDKLEISVWDESSLLIKDLTIVERVNSKSEREVLSDDIFLPGFKKEPIKIGVFCNFTNPKWKEDGGDVSLFIQDLNFTSDILNIKLIDLHGEVKGYNWSVQRRLNRVGNFHTPMGVNRCINDRFRNGSLWLIVTFSLRLFDEKITFVRKIVPLSISPTSDLARTAYESGTGLDFTIYVDGNQIKASTFILSQKSEVFASMFATEWKESREKRIDINDVSFKAMSTFVEILHGIPALAVVPGSSPSTAMELMYICEKYQVLDLKKQAQQQTIASINNENVVESLITATRYDFSEIRKEALDYITSDKFDAISEINGLANVQPEILIAIIEAYRTKFIH